MTQAPRTVPGFSRCGQLLGLGAWTYDVGTRQLTAQANVHELLELPPEAPDPRLGDYFRAVHPDDRAELTLAWQALMRDGQEYCLEHRLVLPDGLLKYMQAVACAELDEAGTVIRAHGMTQDITTRRVAALEVEHQRNRSGAVLASLRDGYLLVQAGLVVEVNDAVCALLDRPCDELLGRPLAAVIPAQLDSCGASCEAGLTRRDGSVLDVHLTQTVLDPDDPDAGSVLIVRDISAQRAYERVLVHRTETDPLTGLMNSRGFRTHLRAEVDRAGDTTPLTLALLDIDHFKQVNDMHGHAVGDEVLVAVAERLTATAGSAGYVARVGGEEFAVLLPDTGSTTAHALLERVLHTMRSTPFRQVGTLTASAGVAELLPGLDDDELYRLADAYLYVAKNRGRDQVR